MYHTAHTQTFAFYLFWPGDHGWPWHKVTKGSGGHLEVSQTRSMSFNRLYFNLIRLLCPVKRAMTDIQKLGLWPELSRRQWRLDKMLQHVRRFKAQSCQTPFSIEKCSISLADSGGGSKTPPPHRRAGSGNTPPGRGLTRVPLWGGGEISLKTRSNIDAKLSVLFPASVLRIVSKFQGKNPSINILRKLRFSDIIFRQSG